MKRRLTRFPFWQRQRQLDLLLFVQLSACSRVAGGGTHKAWYVNLQIGARKSGPRTISRRKYAFPLFWSVLTQIIGALVVHEQANF